MTDPSRPRHLALAVALILVAACGGPTPTATPRGSTVPPSLAVAAATPLPTPSPIPAVATVQPFRSTPRPSDAPADESLPSSASSEHDGIRLTIRLGGVNPMHAGNGGLAFVTIQNTGDSLLRWTNDGCDTNAWINATMPAIWRDSTLEVSPELEPYREWLRETAAVEEPVELPFLPARSVRYRPHSWGCGDLGIGRELAPGRKVTQEFVWDGHATPRLGLPPGGPVTLTSTFERWSRPGPGHDGDPIEVTLDSWVLDGRPDDYLSPAEAIDAALADERLASWLVTRPFRDSADAIAEYDRDLGLWAVGLLMYQDSGSPVLHAAFVDPVTGEVIAIREHRVDF
jgi:hypothetical protein